VSTVKVLLNEAVPNLGKAGDTKEVADGYARNFLIPRGLATVATQSALKQAASTKEAQQRRAARVQTQTSTLATQVGATELVFKAKVGEQHRLFGSITAGDIAEELSKKLGQAIDKRHVELAEPIRSLGSYKVPVRVGAKAVPSVTVVVESEAAGG
jgi:large subunit ribosomal protein L9